MAPESLSVVLVKIQALDSFEDKSFNGSKPEKGAFFKKLSKKIGRRILAIPTLWLMLLKVEDDGLATSSTPNFGMNRKKICRDQSFQLKWHIITDLPI